jgi:hypothetical protein
VAVKLGGHSWVVDLVQNYELTIGSDPNADVRVEGVEVQRRHATLTWNGEHVSVTGAATDALVDVNGTAVSGTARVNPGEEVRIGPAVLQVHVTLAPTRRGRRSLTHHEFAERVGEELARARHSGRPTCLVMLKSRSGDGSKLAGAALGTFRDGDVVGT